MECNLFEGSSVDVPAEHDYEGVQTDRFAPHLEEELEDSEFRG